MRCFIAVPVPEQEREILADAAKTFADALPRQHAKIGWVRPEGMHLTFVFLGEIDGETADRVKDLLDRAAGSVEPFDVGFSGIGQFPAHGRARVLHVPIRRGGDTCRTLHRAIAAVLNGVVDVEDRPFFPHITLGRVKEGTVRAADLEPAARVEGAFRAERIVLFRSHPAGHRGMDYEELHTVGLGRVS